MATGGRISCYNHNGEPFSVELEEMHLEEDSARSIMWGQQRLIDLNRAGAPLLELVSKPVIESPRQAADMLLSVQRLVRYLGISDGKMEDGSLRCDANISMYHGRRNSARMEVKNMNSVAALRNALEFEQKRLGQAMEQNIGSQPETRFYRETNKDTIHGRFKEDTADYRYLPEWDLPAVSIDNNILSEAKAELPEPMEKLMNTFIQTYGLRPETALLLFERRKVPMLFLAAARSSKNPVRAANWLNGVLKNHSFDNISLEKSAQKLSALIGLTEQGRISDSNARSILPEWMCSKQLNPEEFVKTKDLLIESDSVYLANLVQQILDESPSEVKRYKAGRKSLIGFFMGRLMKASGAKAEPVKAKQLLQKKLDER
jgi:aspartyl-tRNA(Asn)/glutamyl-tRNA(Gln) amidotransferase subunit B